MRRALWLMNQFRVSENLVGDIVEERVRGRSAFWLWRQVAVAIAGTVAVDIRTHKWLATRALALGWVLGQCVAAIRRVVIPLMSGDWAGMSGRWLDNAVGFPVLPLPFIIVMGAGAVITGWAIARAHRGHEMSMVSAYIGALLIFYAAGFLNSLGRGLQTFGADGLAVNSLFPFIVTPALIVVGGFLAGPAHHHQRVG